MKKYRLVRFASKIPARRNFIITSLLFAALCFTGCASLGFVTYYDPTTYKNLTDTKPEVLALYDTFPGDSVSQAKIEAVRLKLSQAYEYEKGKGDKNKETYEQIKKIQDMFERHVKERLTDGKWNETHTNNKKQNIADAFDIAIQTERLKNKNEQ
jgi:hypothetical protein